jgi:hypothetical protein
MRCSRFQFRLGTLTLLVVFCALMLYGHRLNQRARWFQTRARMHEGEESGILISHQTSVEMLKLEQDYLNYGSLKTERVIESTRLHVAELKAIVQNEQARMAYHRLLARRYRRAASRPWESLPPDPPPPAE